MTKLSLALATLAMLAAPAFAGSNHDYIDSCEANKYECRGSSSSTGQSGFDAPFSTKALAAQGSFDIDLEDRRRQESNTKGEGVTNGSSSN